MNIEHDEKSNRFIADVDGKTAKLNYQLIGEVMNIIHTEVPEAHEGEGLASELVRTAVEWARNKGMTVEATCKFAGKWLEKHGELERAPVSS